MKNKTKRNGILSVMEIQSTTMTLIKSFQQYAFAKELRILNIINKTSVSIKGNLLALNPFIDNDGLLRVGGRLLNASDISYEQKHHIILPHIEPFSSLFFRHEHERLIHAGVDYAGYYTITILANKR
jgi:hypothetical protein